MSTVPISPLEGWTAARLGVARLDRDAIEHWQLERMRELIGWVRDRSPLYRSIYRDLPHTFPGTLEELQSIPLLDRESLRARGQELVCVSLGSISRVVTMPTSGSTGSPKRLWFTEEDLQLTIDHFRHGMRALVGPGDRVLVLMPGMTPGSVGDLLRKGLGEDGIEVHSYGFVDDCADAMACLLGFGANCIVGVPSQVVRLARSAAGQRIGPDRVKSVLLSGDHVTPAMRAAIEDPWDCRVFEHYGSTELGLGGAVQCRAHSGLHVREADLLFEVIDPETGRVLPDGAEGELVVTTLTRRGMPMIRYRTGDLVRMATEPCVCGSALRCVAEVVGRKDDVLRFAGGQRLTIAHLDEAVYAVKGVLGFAATLEDGPGGGVLTIDVEIETPDTQAAPAEVASRAGALPALAAAGVKVDVVASSLSGSLPRSAKQRIVDARTP